MIVKVHAQRWYEPVSANTRLPGVPCRVMILLLSTNYEHHLGHWNRARVWQGYLPHFLPAADGRTKVVGWMVGPVA